jgi:hypothetical protein
LSGARAKAELPNIDGLSSFQSPSTIGCNILHPTDGSAWGMDAGKNCIKKPCKKRYKQLYRKFSGCLREKSKKSQDWNFPRTESLASPNNCRRWRNQLNLLKLH